MRQIVASIACILLVSSALPYLWDTMKGKTHPNIVTWFTWSLINGISAAAAVSVGAWQTALYTGAATLATTLIMLAGVKYGVTKYTAFDIICQIIALLGIPLWLMTGKPELAVIILLAVDFAGGLPTLRHAWHSPHEETWQTFALSATGSVLLLSTLDRFDIVAVTMPLYITLFDSTILFSIFYRRKKAASS